MKHILLTAVAVAFAGVLGGTTNLEAATHRGGAHVAAHAPAHVATAHVAAHVPVAAHARVATTAHVAVHAPVAAHAHVATTAHVVNHVNVAAHGHATLVVHGRSVSVPVHVRGYRGWDARCWFGNYRSYGYYCGADQLWYYWYPPLNEYLPITYMSIYPPTPVVPVGVVPVTPGLPVSLPTALALPPGATFVPGPITAP